EVCRLDSGGIRQVAALGDGKLTSTAYYSPGAEQGTAVVESNRSPPIFPRYVARPRLSSGHVSPILLASGTNELLPMLPTTDAAPTHLPRPLRKKAVDLQGSSSSPVPGPSFQLYPVPLPMVEAVRPEQARDEFDPGSFNQHRGERR